MNKRTPQEGAPGVKHQKDNNRIIRAVGKKTECGDGGGGFVGRWGMIMAKWDLSKS